MRSRAALVVAALALLVVAATLALWLSGGDPPPAASADDEDEPYGSPEWERWALDDDARAPERPRRAPPAPEGRLAGPPTEREARREERRERWRRGVDIVPLGPAAPGFDADALRDALDPGREALRQCVRDAGGWRAMRGARGGPERGGNEGRGPEGGDRRPRRTASFDVRPDGTVDPGSVELEPAMPEPFDACFRTFFASARLEGVGADGARVEMPMGGRGRRRDLSGDAGVPRAGRWRDGPGGARRRGRPAE